MREHLLARVHCFQVMLVLFCLLLGLHLHFLWTSHATVINGDKMVCKLARGMYTFFFSKVWPYVDASFYSFMPFVIIMFLNVRIIHRVLRERKGSLPQRPESRVTSSTSLVKVASYRVTIMLLCVSFGFLIMTLPVNIVLIANTFRNYCYADRIAKFKLAGTIAEMLMYLNHSSNFFLYCATGHKFRHHLYMLLRGRWRERPEVRTVRVLVRNLPIDCASPIPQE